MKRLMIASFEHRDFYIGDQPGDVFEAGFVRSGATNDSSSMSTVSVGSSGLRRGRECALVMLCRCCLDVVSRCRLWLLPTVLEYQFSAST